jgi:VWFA-related protein
MRWCLGLSGCALTVVLAAALLAPPALAEGPAIAVERVDAAQFPTVRIYVSLATASGVPITGLDAHAFQVHEDGKPVDGLQVEPIVDSQEPIAAALVIDTSGSMADEAKLDKARDAATAFIDQLGPADRATVVSFADEVSVVQDYASDRAALKAAIGSLKAKGNTALYDAVAQTARRQAVQPERRKPLILLTDGADTHSTASLENSIAAATGGPVYAIGLGSDVKHDVLDQLASATGGQAIYLPDAEQLKPTFLSIADQLRRQYVLRYTSAVTAEAKPHGLAVQAAYSGYQVSGLGSFSPPAPPAPTVSPAVTPAPQPTSPAPTPAPTAAPTQLPAPSPLPSPLPLSMSDLVLGVGLLLVLLGLVLGVWYLVRQRHRLVLPEPEQVQASEPDDLTEDVAGATALGDVTFVRPRGPDAVRARLLIARRGEERQVTLDQPEATLGRDDATAVPLQDPQASRKHARIFRQNGHYWIEDLNSLNGTQVNGETVTRHQLNPKDRIGIGETVLTFLVDPA